MRDLDKLLFYAYRPLPTGGHAGAEVASLQGGGYVIMWWADSWSGDPKRSYETRRRWFAILAARVLSRHWRSAL